MTHTFSPLNRREIYDLVALLRTPRSASEVAIILGTPYERIKAVLEYWKEIGKVRHAELNGCTAHWLYVL